MAPDVLGSEFSSDLLAEAELAERTAIALTQSGQDEKATSCFRKAIRILLSQMFKWRRSD